MQDQLVSFKVAKLAKEKGFGIDFVGTEYVPAFYCKKSDVNNFQETEIQIEDGFMKDFYLRPTQSLLQKWLRDKHKLEVCVSFSPDWEWNDKDECLCTNMGYRVDWGFVGVWKKYEIESYPLERHGFKTYEQALEEGLYEALTLIKNE